MWYKVKKIYVGTQQVRPHVVPPRTFTISWTETSNPAQFNPTYSDDAAWLTAGSTAFDEFFGYSAVLLWTDWQEKAEVTQESSWWYGKLDFSSLWTLTWTTNNVMVKFPMRWIKMSKSWSTVTLSITDEPNADGYQYYAFTKWWTIKDNMYLWAFKSTLTNWTSASSSGTIAKSWATKSRTANVSPMTNKTISVSNTYSANNWTWYSQIAFFQRMYVNALYMMKYGNPDSQNVIWKWYTWGDQSIAPWNTVSASNNATYWTSSSTSQIKLFWLEDWWWNIEEWVDWIYTNSNWAVYVATDNSSFYNTSIPSSVPSNYSASGISMSANLSWNISSIWWGNISMFIPNASDSNQGYNTYYCTSCTLYASSFAFAGGMWWNSTTAGAIRLNVSVSSSDTTTYRGSRLMYL